MTVKDVTLTKTEIGIKITEYCYDRPDYVLGRFVEGHWNLGLEKSLSVLWAFGRSDEGNADDGGQTREHLEGNLS